MFADGSVLNLIHLEKLSLEDDEVSSLLGIEVNTSFLIFFEGVDDFKEVSLGQEELIITLCYSGVDFFNWVEEGVLIKVSLQGIRLEFLDAKKMKGMVIKTNH